MSEAFDELVHRHLDGTLEEDGEAALARILETDPAAARAFARIGLIHDGLAQLIRQPMAGGQPLPSLNRKRLLSGRWGLAGFLAASVAVAALAIWWPGAGNLKASTTLERLIKASSRQRDRTYVISDLDPGSRAGDPRQPPIDGAVLHVRQPGSFVLIRSFPDGRKYVTGSDGDRNWSVPPEGKVRVSADPLRFRWPLPGHVHGIPFVNPTSDLADLKRDYHLELRGTGADGLSLLRADMKDSAGRGPRRVDLLFDPESGVIRRMVFDGLPRARGGPRSVAVELIGQGALQDSFFSHEAHHEPGRPVEEED